MEPRKPVQVPVREVTVLEDRALVRRSAEVALAPGRHRLVVEGVAPVAIDKSLLWESSAGTTISDARFVRTSVHADADKPDDLRVLDDTIEDKKRALATLVATRRACEKELEDTGALGHALVGELSMDAAWGREVGARHEAAFASISLRDAALRGELATSALTIDELKEELALLTQRRRNAGKPTSKRIARIELDVVATEDGTATLTLTYVVPNACWRPRHRAVLDDTEKKVTFTTEAIVWQNTGEAWDDVALGVSSERPSLGTQPPRLEADVLSAARKGALVVETREEEVEETGLGAGEVRVVQDLPRIDDGGEPITMRSKHRVAVASDGRPRAIPITTFEAPAQIDLVCMPELASAVVSKVVFENTGGRPLLAGPVELVRGGGHVGRTTIDFIADKEKLALGFGPDGALRVHRDIEPLKDETSMLSSWTTKSHDVRVRISNLGPYAKSITVTERVPVSEIEKVQVHTVPRETTNEREPDSNGFVRWNVELAPFGHQLLKLRVVTKKHSDVHG